MDFGPRLGCVEGIGSGEDSAVFEVVESVLEIGRAGRGVLGGGKVGVPPEGVVVVVFVDVVLEGGRFGVCFFFFFFGWYRVSRRRHCRCRRTGDIISVSEM